MIRQYPASLDYLRQMLAFVSNETLNAGFVENEIYPIELAVEEALVNIINYAYGDKDERTLQIQCDSKIPEQITITIIDKGIPYNPLSAVHSLEKSTRIENRAIGGYGIFFILKIMDEVRYKREDGKNILCLIKYRS